MNRLGQHAKNVWAVFSYMFPDNISTKKKAAVAVSLFYGAETHMIEEEVEAVIKRSLDKKYKGLNLSYFQGEHSSPEEIINLANTPPFLDKTRVVVVTDFEKFSAEKSKKLLTYIKSPLPTTRLVLTGEKVNKSNPVLGALRKKGHARAFYHMSQHRLITWIKQTVRKNGQEIEQQAARFLIERVGSETKFLSHELEKLGLFTLEQRTICLEDVKRATSSIKTFTVFELTENIGLRKKEKALIILNRIFQQGEPPIVVLSMIIRQFRLIWLAKILIEKKKRRGEILKKLGIPPFAYEALEPQTSLFTSRDLRGIFLMLHNIDLAMKSESGNHERSLENFIFQVTDI